MDENKSIRVNIDFSSAPILYTDNVHYDQNDDMVFINALQVVGPQQLRAVARLAMSRTFAKRVVNDLAKLLAISENQVKEKGKRSAS